VNRTTTPFIGRSVTDAACAGGDAQLDEAYFRLLRGVNAFTIEDGLLTLYTDDGTISLTEMEVGEYMPRFVALGDGRRCDRLTPFDTVRLDGERRTYVCQSGDTEFIIGDLQPDGDGWRATLVQVADTASGYVVESETEVRVTLPQP